MPMSKTIQAKHIPDQEIIDASNAYWKQMYLGRVDRHGDYSDVIGMVPTIALAHKYPEKVILRKMESMIKRGILSPNNSVRTSFVVDSEWYRRITQ